MAASIHESGGTITVFGECMGIAIAIAAVKKQLASDNPDVVLKAAKMIFDLEKAGMRHNCEVTGGSAVVPASDPERTVEPASRPVEKPRAPQADAKPAEPRELKAEAPKPVPPLASRTNAVPPKPVPSGTASAGHRMQDLAGRKLTKFLCG